MLEKLFDVCILEWNSVATQSLQNQLVVPIGTRPLVLSEQSQVIFGTNSIPSSLESSYLRHELFAVSFSQWLSHETTTLQWTGYVTTCGIDDITLISQDRIVAALQDSSLNFFQVSDNQLSCIDHIPWSLSSDEREQVSIREMAYNKNDYILWCAREDGTLGQYHILSGKWTKWSPIRDSFSSIRVVEELCPHVITSTTDHGIFYIWDHRQNTEAFHWNAHKQEMFAHHVKRNEVVIGYGDGNLSTFDIRYYGDNIGNKVAWIDTKMQAIGNICHIESSSTAWCLFGSPSSEIWTWGDPFHMNEEEMSHVEQQQHFAKRLWKTSFQENGYLFYAMNGK